VSEALTDDLKATCGPFAYLLSAALIVPNLTGYNTTIAWEDGLVERVEALNTVVANGRTCAGGFQVAPLANPEDGLLDGGGRVTPLQQVVKKRPHVAVIICSCGSSDGPSAPFFRWLRLSLPPEGHFLAPRRGIPCVRPASGN
jgi:YegS C-terminal NAD kinase beta sandwich-like domain